MKYRYNWLISKEEEDRLEKPVHTDLPGKRRTKARRVKKTNNSAKKSST